MKERGKWSMGMMNTVLLIDEQIVNDDDDIICSETERTLEKTGIAKNIKVINNIQDALDYLKFQCCAEQILSPEWIIFDQSLNQGDCLEFLTAFGNFTFANKASVVLIRLCETTSEDRTLLKSAGVKEFISKPTSTSELKALQLKYSAEKEEQLLRKAS
jgi:response regulator RpfG family c-di-GMP phosphodiesterase